MIQIHIIGFSLIFMLLLDVLWVAMALLYWNPGLHKLWYPTIWDTSTWSKFGTHGEHGDAFLFSNLGAL